jgi:hypothetical protein
MTRRKDPMPAEEPVSAEGPAKPLADIEVSAPVDDPPDATRQAPEPSATSAPQTEKPRGSGLLGPVLGGAVAAIGGFALSHFNLVGLAPTDVGPEIAALSQALDQLQVRDLQTLEGLKTDLAALEDRVSKIASASPAPTPDLSRLEDLERRLDAIAALPAEGGAPAAALAARLAKLEDRVARLPETEADPDLSARLDAALARLNAAEAAAVAGKAEADAAKAAADRAVAMDALAKSVVSGAAFLPELKAVNDPALTAALAPFAETGVPTLAALQADFPDAARTALQISRDLSTEHGWGARLVDFLADQTGARSVAPRDGTAPDAVLSRAEFALSEGRVADALTELQALDPAIAEPLSAWTGAATAHLAAQSALAAARGE